MEIYVQKRDAQSVRVKAQQTDTIKFVKAQVQQKTGIPCEKQYLIYCGKNLDDNSTLASNKIRDMTILSLFNR